MDILLTKLIQKLDESFISLCPFYPLFRLFFEDFLLQDCLVRKFRSEVLRDLRLQESLSFWLPCFYWKRKDSSTRLLLSLLQQLLVGGMNSMSSQTVVFPLSAQRSLDLWGSYITGSTNSVQKCTLRWRENYSMASFLPRIVLALRCFSSLVDEWTSTLADCLWLEIRLGVSTLSVLLGEFILISMLIFELALLSFLEGLLLGLVFVYLFSNCCLILSLMAFLCSSSLRSSSSCSSLTLSSSSVISIFCTGMNSSSNL